MNRTQTCSSGRRWAGWLVAITLVGLGAPVAASDDYPEPLPVEPVPSVATLATPYPPGYAMVHDFGFGSLIDSAFSLVDTRSGRFMGMLSAGNFATLAFSRERQEFYVGETYYRHGSRGERSDLVTVYDMENLDVQAEIRIPAKRAAIVAQKNAMAVTESGRFLLAFNLTPATSVSVVDLEERKFVDEIPTPGCALVYPTRGNEFMMLCGDGALLRFSLNESGAVVSRARSEPFIDIDNDPLSEKASKVNGVWQFISFRGDVQPVSDAAEPGERWSLTTESERAANWRPAGWHWTAAHPDGLLWVGMTPNGYDGSHKDPAMEVWLFDLEQRKRLARLPLSTPGLSIDVTLDEEPRLLVLNVEGSLDVYDAHSGDYQRTIHDLGGSPLQVHRMP